MTITARTRALLIAAVVAGGAGLVRWTQWLGQVLPDQHASTHWRLAWVGLDVALSACLLAAGRLAWIRHRAAVPALTATAVLLACDAWFDVVLDWGTADTLTSLVLALLVELPVAGALLLLARPVTGGGVPTVVVRPEHAERVFADDDCRRVSAALDLVGPARVPALARAAGLGAPAAAAALARMRDAGVARRRPTGRWRRVVLDLRWMDAGALPADDPDRDRYALVLARRRDREERILTAAGRRWDTFGAWATGSRSAAWLTPAELASLEREYRELVTRYAVRSRPGGGRHRIALRFYAFPNDVVDEVDTELALTR